MRNTKKNYQKLFFKKLKANIGQNINPVYEISTLLGISIDAVYRRLRGETLLNFDEIIILCRKFNLNIDEFINDKNNSQIKFNYMPLQEEFNNCYMKYINSLKSQLNTIVNQKGLTKKIYFAATDIPIFHLCKFPELKAFKVYTWQKHFQKGYNIKFSIDKIITPDMVTIFKEISNLYDQVDSIEVWTNRTIDSYLNLIQYFYEIDCFESVKDVDVLLDKLLVLIDIIKKYGEYGFKISQGKRYIYNLFLSEIELENNLIYAETNDINIAFVKLYSINTIGTTNPLFCKGTKTWFDSVISKSALISGFSQKQFILFFKNINRKIETLRASIHSK